MGRRAPVNIIVHSDAAQSTGVTDHGMRALAVPDANCVGSQIPSVRRIVTEQNFPMHSSSSRHFRESVASRRVFRRLVEID